MNKKIISLLFVLILGLSVGMVGIQSVSATGSAKSNYTAVYPNFPVPNCGPNGLCHAGTPSPGDPKLAPYGQKLQTLAGGPGNFKAANTSEKQRILKLAGSGVKAQLGLNPLSKDIDIGTVGHFTLTLTTNVNANGGQLTWQTDDPLILAGIDAVPSGQSGSLTISKNSACAGSPQICTATFDIQVKPQNGITANTDHSITLSAFNNQNTDKVTATVTGGINPVPELAVGILMTAGLIGLIGLVRYKKK